MYACACLYMVENNEKHKDHWDPGLFTCYDMLHIITLLISSKGYFLLWVKHNVGIHLIHKYVLTIRLLILTISSYSKFLTFEWDVQNRGLSVHVIFARARSLFNFLDILLTCLSRMKSYFAYFTALKIRQFVIVLS